MYTTTFKHNRGPNFRFTAWFFSENVRMNEGTQTGAITKINDKSKDKLIVIISYITHTLWQ